MRDKITQQELSKAFEVYFSNQMKKHVAVLHRSYQDFEGMGFQEYDTILDNAKNKGYSKLTLRELDMQNEAYRKRVNPDNIQFFN